MSITATQLRKNIYQVIDRVSMTGVPVRVTRKGHSVLLVPAEKRSKLSNLRKRPVMKCPPDEIIHLDWSKEWKPFI